jgi:excinuclease UvrABC ATPase subunit
VVIATGTPEAGAASEGSATGQYLRQLLPKKAAAAA